MQKLIKLALVVHTILSPVVAADKVTYQLDWLPGGDYAPVYVGIQQGFFAEQDIEVSIANGRGATDALTRMAMGRADIGTVDIGALMMAKGQDDVAIKAVLPYFTQPPQAFYSLQGSGIESFNDLEGKRVATSPFSASNVYLPLILGKSGLSEDAVNLLKADPGALGPMMVAGNTDAVIAWVTNAPLFRAQAATVGKQINVMPWHTQGFDLYSSSLVASERFLEQRPDVAKRFVTAFAQSIEFTYQHPDQAAAAIHAMVPEVDPAIAADQIRSITDLVYNDVTQDDGFGVFNPQRVEKTWEYVATANSIDFDVLDPQTVISSDFLSE